MTIARKYLIDPQSTPYYHIISRCQLLSKLFSIDVCAYAIMSNHFHLVLKVNPERSHTWTYMD